MSNNSPSKLPAYEQRLRAREQLLEQRAHRYEQDLQDKQQYIKTDGKTLISTEVIQSVGNNSPFLGKITNKLLGSPLSKEQIAPKQAHQHKNFMGIKDPEALQERLTRIGTIALPLLITIGGRRLLSCSLRSAGTIIRHSIGSTLGLRRKRRRKR